VAKCLGRDKADEEEYTLIRRAARYKLARRDVWYNRRVEGKFGRGLRNREYPRNRLKDLILAVRRYGFPRLE